ncbi:hypothetical protein F53441_10809 [Fusarium austroafricanum]|uniref:Endonuclease/exonuclease/phosphatase domain-containing protein n=1 Tax=Fusarium austroafricanum TaxID=2364996 RepID=A0A8H4K825_9HYPO|nr:hypothetical protein F53441_10809 [Fusarium austroafricanum]
MEEIVQKAIQNAIASKKPDSSLTWQPDQPWKQSFYQWAANEWQPLQASEASASSKITKLAIYSWNIDFMLPYARARMNTALAHLEELTRQHRSDENTAVVVSIQECVPSDLFIIGEQQWIRDDFYRTDEDTSAWASGAYGTTTLVDRRLQVLSCFRVHFSATRMERDGLFVDVKASGQTIRLCNTHLESLALEPPLRPAQMRIIASHMHAPDISGAAVTGDFNAIQPFDLTLHTDNKLEDAYLQLGGQEGDGRGDDTGGYTWGQQAHPRQRNQFGCSRMDKVFFCGDALKLVEFERFGADVELDEEELRAKLEELGFEKPWITDHLGDSPGTVFALAQRMISVPYLIKLSIAIWNTTMGNESLGMASRPAIAAPLILLVSYVIYSLFIKPSKLPDLPILGARKGDWFPLLQAKIRNSWNVKPVLNTAWSQHREQAFLLPMLDSPTYVYLPRSDTKFASEQPITDLSMHESAQNDLQTDWTTMDPSLTHDPIHLELVASTLTKEVGNLIPDLADEVDYCVSKQLGNSADWTEVCVMETAQKIISGITNRAFVGLPLCRNQEMLKLGIAFAQDIPTSSIMLRVFPEFIKPLVAPLICRPNRIHTREFEKILEPEINARLHEYDLQDQPSKSERNDFLQWSIEQAKEIGNPKNWTVSALAQRILLLNFASIHTTTFAVTHALLDMAAYSPDLILELREEIVSVLQQHNNQWNKRAVAQLEKLDSAIRESQRKNSIVTVGVSRTVVAEKGVTFPSGIHVPKGLRVAVPGYTVLQDSEIYPDPKTYQPLRFYQARQDEAAEYVKSARNALPTATTDFLAWGLGRHACPGRFFASNEIKMLIAYILLNYDIEHLAERPRNTWISQNRIPPMKATLKFRRKSS